SIAKLENLDIKKLREITNLVESSNIEEIKLEVEGVKISINNPKFRLPEQGTRKEEEPEPAEKKSGDLVEIKSPIVGTFYSASSSDSSPFVNIGKSDLFRLFIPEEYEGMGTGIFEVCLATEELSRGDLSVATSYAASGLGLIPILVAGNEEQKKKYLPQLASGEKLAAFGLTEAEAGSDAGSIRTTASKDGDFYILNGTKQWITNGGEADIYTIFAMTNPEKGVRGASAIIVEKGTEG
ncbi:unnamed protein product, partial [marine sediment metagenome]